jgi:hypothetical protein
MSRDRQRRYRAGRWVFRPALDGREELEPRLVLSVSLRGLALHQKGPLPPSPQPQPFRIQTAMGGRAVALITPTGGRFFVEVDSTLNNGIATVANGGFVRAYVMPGNQIGLIVDATTPDSELTINPFNKFQRKGLAHQFSAGQARSNATLNIGSIEVTSGQIGAVLGYHTANLAGPLVISGTEPVQRIAFNSILPGGSITVGGDLNQLTVLNDIDLSGSTGINIGRDLNWLYTTGNLTIGNGANFNVGRDVGLLAQSAATGSSAPGGQGAFVQGNVTIAPGSTLTIARNLDANFTIEGSLNGSSRFFVGNPAGSTGMIVVKGTVTP